MPSFSSHARYFLRLLIILSLLISMLFAPIVQAEPAPQVAVPTMTPSSTVLETPTMSLTPDITPSDVAITATATITESTSPLELTPSATLGVDETPTDTSLIESTLTPVVTETPTPPETFTDTLPITDTVNPSGGQVIFGQPGKDALTLDFPAGALDKSVNVSVSALDKLPAELPREVWYKDFGVDVKINTLADDTKVDKTTLPVTVTLHYTGLPMDFGNETSQKLLALYHFNEEQQAWERLWTTVDPASGVLTATLSSFSPVVLTSGTQTNTGDFAKPWQPAVQSFQVDQFTGAATWSIPIEAPAGRSGLGGGLSLEYSSAVVDETHGQNNPQSPGIGTGWSLGGAGYIERKIVRDGNGTPQVDANGGDIFHLVLNGVSSDLVCIDTSVTPCVEYRMKDEHFWRIRKLTGAPNESELSGIPGLRGEYWLVTDSAGTTYRFGWSGDPCRYNNTVPNPNPNGCSGAYAANEGEQSAFYLYGKEISGPQVGNLSAYIWRWNLDRVADVHNTNIVSYFYTREYDDYYVCNGNDPVNNCWYGVDGLNNSNALPYFYLGTPGVYTLTVTNSGLHSIPLTPGGATFGYTRGGYLRQITYTRGNGLPAPYTIILNTQVNLDV